MVEDALRKAEEYPSKRQLWLSLEKKVMYQTFNIILSVEFKYQNDRYQNPTCGIMVLLTYGSTIYPTLGG